jgi:hypothetical protein
VSAAATVPQKQALLALAVAAVLGLLTGGAIGQARDAPATGGAAPAAAAPRAESPLARELRRFNGVHLEQRVLLANSVTSGEQAQVATNLALDFAMAARRFDRLGATPETVTVLEDLAQAYDRLATAAEIRDAGSYLAAAKEIAGAEGRLRALLRPISPS